MYGLLVGATQQATRQIIRRRWARLAIVGLCAALPALIGLSLAHAADAPAKPAINVKPYGDWLLRCQSKNAGLCEVAQTIAVGGQKSPIAEIVFGRLSPQDPLRLIVQLPLGTWLQTTPVLLMDDKSPGIAIPFTRCAQNCMAEVALKPEVLAALKSKSGAGKLTFTDFTMRQVAIPVSFKGLAQALVARGS